MDSAQHATMGRETLTHIIAVRSTTAIQLIQLNLQSNTSSLPYS
jgi:hypothetical protein